MDILEAKEYFIDLLDLMERSQETIRGYNSDLGLFESYLSRHKRGTIVSNVTVSDIEGFLLELKRQGLAPASRNRRLYTLRSFFKYCQRKGLCQDNPAALVEVIRLPYKEREYMTEEEVWTILGAIESNLMLTVVALLFYSGLRIKEALNLRKSDVRLGEGVIRVRAGKGKRDRSVPICPKLLEILKEYTKKSINGDSEFFFATKKTGSLSPQYVNFRIKQAVETLGWDRHVTAHSFRHSFASALVKKNVSVFYIQQLLGHADMRVTSRYCHTNIEDLRQAVTML